MSKRSAVTLASCLILVGAMGGCSVLERGVVEDTPTAAPESGGTFNAGTSIFGEGGIGEAISGGKRGTNDLPVNAFLWRASLDTLGATLPLESTDPFSGVITTAWGASPSSPNDRVRAVARVTSEELSANALEVNVFRETLSPTGAWLAAETAESTREQLKDAILTRARQLRIDSIDEG